jgi:hypothetical protein
VEQNKLGLKNVKLNKFYVIRVVLFINFWKVVPDTLKLADPSVKKPFLNARKGFFTEGIVETSFWV